MNTARRLAPLTCAAVALLASAPLPASPLFDSDDVIDIVLEGPLGDLLEQRDPERELPFLLHAQDRTHRVALRPRGKSRLQLCHFPPLRLRFESGDTANSVFAGQEKVKLVTHCSGTRAAEINALQEYMAYRVFNVLSDVSYRVRLLHITYRDTSGAEDLQRHGFLIESSAELAGRTGTRQVSVAGLSMASLEPQQAATAFVFHYLVANTDWSLVSADGDDACCHNGDLFEGDGKHYYVPYDFDLTGLVNPRYARRGDRRAPRVTRRQYRGYCLPREAVAGAVTHVNALEDRVLAVPGSVPGVPARDASSSARYLAGYFREARDADRLIEHFQQHCL